MWYLVVIVAALAGAFSAIFGWIGSDSPFVPRKFSYGIIRGAIAGVIIGTQWTITAPIDYVILFLAAGGFDQLVSDATKRITS